MKSSLETKFCIPESTRNYKFCLAVDGKLLTPTLKVQKLGVLGSSSLSKGNSTGQCWWILDKYLDLSWLVLKLSYPILGQCFFSVPQLKHQETSAFLTLSVGTEGEHWHEMGYISTWWFLLIKYAVASSIWRKVKTSEAVMF